MVLGGIEEPQRLEASRLLGGKDHPHAAPAHARSHRARHLRYKDLGGFRPSRRFTRLPTPYEIRNNVKLPGVEIWRMASGKAKRMQSQVDTAKMKAALGR